MTGAPAARAPAICRRALPAPGRPAGKDWHAPQLAGWYKALLRDEVLAEWRGAAAAAVINASAGGLRRLDRAAGGGAGSGGPQPSAPVLPSLHIYCHVSTAWEVARGAARLPWPPAPPHLRARIFEKVRGSWRCCLLRWARLHALRQQLLCLRPSP